MKIKYGSFLVATFVLIFISLFAGSAQAQLRTVAVPSVQVCQQVPSVYIRSLRYDDYSRYTRMSPATVAPGGFFQIATNCLRFDGQIVVTLQDVNRGPGFGVTAFRLTNVRVSGNTVTAQAPNLPMFRNRTYHVAIFVYGQQPWKTANPGQLTIR